MPFVKGQVGNPKGRPRVENSAANLARLKVVQAIDALVQNLSDESGQVRNAAAIALLDRGFGKPTQTLASDPDNPIIPTAVQVALVRPDPKD